MDVVVTGIGLICCLGNLAQTWQHLLAGDSGIKLHQPFTDLPAVPLGLIGTTPTQLTSLTRQMVAEAIKDARLSLPSNDCGVVIGSSRGCQAQWESRTEINWLESLPDQPALTAAAYLGSQSIVLAPMAACATGILAIARGYELLQTGACERVAVGAVETPITPLTLIGFQRMGALARTGCYPFDRRREGLVLGEGGAVLILETAELAAARGAKVYGRVRGFGLTCDAQNICAPEADAKSAAHAILQCLERSGLQAGEINFIHSHGTSTKLNDSNEAGLIRSLFGDRVSVSSTKGATGHTLGASGAIGAAFCLMALQQQQLPPCVGLSESEFDLNLIRQVTSYSQLNHVLNFSFGFGGQNAIIAFSRY